LKAKDNGTNWILSVSKEKKKQRKNVLQKYREKRDKCKTSNKKNPTGEWDFPMYVTNNRVSKTIISLTM
jgi:hypothetical protein